MHLPTYPKPDPPLYAETIDGDTEYNNKVATSFFVCFFHLSKYRQFSSSLPILPFFFSLRISCCFLFSKEKKRKGKEKKSKRTKRKKR